MKIKSRGVIYLRQRRYLLASVCFLVSVLTIGGIFKFIANAQYGNFVDNVKTSMRILNQENGAEKTKFLSGETINFASRIEVTSNDQTAVNYNNAYLLIKIPKQYVLGLPRYTATSAVSSMNKQDTDTYFVQRVNYNTLQSGTINSINFDVALKNIETPGGYVLQAIHELYDENGRLLSSQAKEITTTKTTPNLNVGKNNTNGDKNVQYIATYTDNTNSTIDRSSFSRMGVVDYLLQANLAYPSGDYGHREPANIVFTDNVPANMELTEASINSGWKFDQAARRATYTLTDVEELKKATSSVKIQLRFKNDTPESVFNTKVVNTANIEYNFKDGLSLEKVASHSLTVRPLLKTNKDAFGIYKSLIWQNSNNINAIPANAPAVYWDIGVNINNNGQTVSVPIGSVFDNLPEEFFTYQIEYSLKNIDYDKLNFNTIKVIGHLASGETYELGRFTKSTTKIKLSEDSNSGYNIKDIRRIEFKFEDGYELPVQIDGVNEYKINFRINTKFKDINSIKLSIPNNGTHRYINEASANMVGRDLRVEDSVTFRREANKIVNELAVIGKNYTSKDGVIFYILYNSVTPGNLFPMSLSSVDSNAKSMMLFSKDMGIRKGVIDAIKDGSLTYIRDYKNTGKSALINNGVRVNNQFVDGINPGDMFFVDENTRSGEHTFELITFWPDNNPDYYGTEGIDDLDFNNDGIESRNVARSSVRINVVKPEQVGIRKRVRSLKMPFAKSVDGLQPGENIEYQLSIINSFDDALRSSRLLEVLPRSGDKNIVEGNDGVQKNRNSTTSVYLTGPIAAKNGFSILYSTDAPGNSKDESWAKNFIPEAQITDWSQVRMIKIVQNPGHEIPPQQIVDFIVSAKISDDAEDNSIANNTVAVAVLGSGLVESEVVPATVEYPGKIEGVVFEDINKNSIFDRNTDIALDNYIAKLYMDDKLIETKNTDNQGHYEFFVNKLGTYTVRFEKPASANPQFAVVPSRGDSQSKDNGSHYSAMQGNDFATTTRQITANDKNHKLNIGFEIPRGNVIAKYQTADGVQLIPDVKVKDNASVGENYQTSKNSEITKDGLVYSYSSLANNSDLENGSVEVTDKTVIYIYAPKLGSSVKVQFYNEEGTQIKPEATIFAEGTQVGREYSSTPNTEVVHQGITYVYKELKNDSDPQVGRVKTTPQIIKYVYTPKKGGQVIANYVNQDGETILNTKVVKSTDTPVGTAYSDTPPAEITTNDGLVYTYELLKSGSQNGTVRAETQEIVYQYKKKEGGVVKAKFVDEQGNKLKTESIVAAQGTQVGSNYTATKDNEITKDGLVYTFKKRDESSSLESGKVTVQSQTVVYVYSPKVGGMVKAKFIDENGNELRNEEIVKAKDTQVGTNYEAQNPNEITKGGLTYIYKALKDGSTEKTGKVKTEDQTVVFVYTPKLSGGVVAKYIDKNGKEIQDTNVISPKNTQVGTPYQSTGPDRIEISGKKYKLVEIRGEESGKVTDGDIEIIYVYEEEIGIVEAILSPNTGIGKAVSYAKYVFVACGLLITTIYASGKMKRRV